MQVSVNFKKFAEQWNIYTQFQRASFPTPLTTIIGFSQFFLGSLPTVIFPSALLSPHN